MMKPNQDIFKYVLEKNRLSLDETLFIDDHHPNINSAEAMGLSTIQFLNAQQCLKKLNDHGVAIDVQF